MALMSRVTNYGVSKCTKSSTRCTDPCFAISMPNATQPIYIRDVLDDLNICSPLMVFPVGHAAIPRDVACCEVTVNFPSLPLSGTSGNRSDSIHVVNDLSKHPEFCNRPFVSGHPHGRFYAGVPITTPSGVNIGAYCILDDKPREGVSQRETTFLCDMSNTVMQHLETVRALAERQQNSKMVAGLGEFIRASSITTSDASGSTDMPLGRSTNSTTEIHSGAPDALIDAIVSPLPTSQSAKSEYFDNTTVLGQQDRESSPDVSTPTARPKTALRGDLPINEEGTRAARSRPTSRQSFKSRPPMFRKSTTGTRDDAYQRAAEIMCRSLCIDGVAFLDAAVESFGGLAENTETSTGADSEDSSHSLSDFGPRDDHHSDTKACKIRGCAQTVRTIEIPQEPAQPAKTLTQSFIRGLMRRNPKGRVWTFGHDFATYSDDGSTTDNDTVSVAATPEPARKSRRERRSDAENLQLAFPGARCIALYGIWDYTRRRWASAGLFWSYDPFRVLCMETEMRFVTTFCDVVIAETRRLEVADSDKAKSDFISSVSHELRSPLHGILGSAELLTEQDLGSAASTMVQQINSCGHTLLDVIDHLLDFANLRQQHLKKGVAKSSNIGRKFFQSATPFPTIALSNDLSALSMDVSLRELTEDVVASSVYSYHYNRENEPRGQTLVILDVELLNNSSWRCQLATGGWRRICINLVTNALKYTRCGYVRVSLKRKFRSGVRRFDAVLSVTDSGQGMSDEFQRNHLFRHFTQEDTLSNGLGIGMHMVSRMVNAMGGKIEVTSSQKGTGKGTRVVVTVPLQHHRDRVESDVGSYASALHVPAGLKVGLISQTQQSPMTSQEGLIAVAWEVAIASIRKDLESLGCKLQNGVGVSDLPDLMLVMEVELESYLKSIEDEATSNNKSHLAPLLVICSNALTAHDRLQSWSKNSLSTEMVVLFVALPCSMKQLSDAIGSISTRRKERMASALVRPAEGSLHAASETSARQESSRQDAPPGPFPCDSGIAEVATPKPYVTHVAVDLSQGIAVDAQSLRATLPLLLQTQTAASQDVPDHEPSTSSLNGDGSLSTAAALSPKQPRLLLVDDNHINLKLLETFAKKRRYPYVTASDGQLALDAYLNSHKSILSHPDQSVCTDGVPSVILLDINMPVMDGYEAAQRIRAYERKHHLVPATIIAVTALDSEAAQTEAYGSGFNMFLNKPIKLKVLTQILENL